MHWASPQLSTWHSPTSLTSEARNGSFKHQPCWFQKARNPPVPDSHSARERHRPEQKPPGQLSLTSAERYGDYWVFPGGSAVKNPPASAGDAGFIPGSGSSPGEGSSNPLQYSCLGNPMDRGAWWATVHGVAKSQTQQSNETTTKMETILNWRHAFSKPPPLPGRVLLETPLWQLGPQVTISLWAP